MTRLSQSQTDPIHPTSASDINLINATAQSAAMEVIRMNRLRRSSLSASEVASRVRTTAPASVSGNVRSARLSEAALIEAGDVLVSTNGAWPARARVAADARIEMDDELYDSPSAAASAAKGGAANGWDFWARQTPTGSVPLSTLEQCDSVTSRSGESRGGHFNWDSAGPSVRGASASASP